MERWFLHQDREPTGSKIASRRGSKSAVLLARGPLPCVEADAGSQDSWRTGEFSLAFLPYGKWLFTEDLVEAGALRPLLEAQVLAPGDRANGLHQSLEISRYSAE